VPDRATFQGGEPLRDRDEPLSWAEIPFGGRFRHAVVVRDGTAANASSEAEGGFAPPRVHPTREEPFFNLVRALRFASYRWSAQALHDLLRSALTRSEDLPLQGWMALGDAFQTLAAIEPPPPSPPYRRTRLVGTEVRPSPEIDGARAMQPGTWREPG
jgi:hypothetical protein